MTTKKTTAEDTTEATTDGSDLTVSTDTFANPDEQLLTVHPTIMGADGIERIAGPSLDNWKPAPTEASDEEKEAAVRREEMFAEASRKRQEAMGIAVPETVKSDETEAANAPAGVGGSGSSS